LIHLTAAGLSVRESTRMLSEEFGCSERTIWRDWKTRVEWLAILFKTGEGGKDAAVFDRMAELEEAKMEAYRTYLREEGMIKVAALRLYLDAVKEDVRFRQSLGLLHAEPMKVEERVMMVGGRFCRVGRDGKATPVDDSQVS